MIFKNSKISIRQLQALFIIEVFATAVVFMPEFIWENLWGSGFLGVILASLLLMCCVWLLMLVYGDGEETFAEVTEKCLGKALGKIIIFVFWLKIVIVSGIWLKEFATTTRDVMLYDTPYEVISAVIIAACFFMAVKGIEVRGRTGEIFIVIMFALFLPAIIAVSLGADFSNILTVKSFGIKKGINTVFGIFTALGTADYLWFLYPKTNREKRKSEIIKAVVITGFIVSVTVAVVFAVFGDAMGEVKWPVLRMMDTVDFPGAFIERQDLLVTGMWILGLYIYISGGLTYGAYLFKETTGKSGWNISCILAFVISVAKFPVVFSVSEIMTITTPVFMIALPLLMLIGKKVRLR